MPLLDDVFGSLKNLYGNGGAGDPLVSIGMGLLSQRGVGRGLAAGFQNAAQMSDIANQRARQAMLDKLAQERESRQVANDQWTRQWQIDQATRNQNNWQKTFDANQANTAADNARQAEIAARPPEQVRTAQWIALHPQEAAAAGMVNKVENDAASKEKAVVNARLQQGQALGLQGEALNSYALTGSIQNPNEKVTNDQANAALFTRRMAASNDILRKPEIWKSGTGWTGAEDNLLSKVPVVGNFLVSKEFQQNRQAQEDFINSVLRRESGAAISPSEFDHANRQYFPQPGDSEEVIVQKAANRENAMKGILGATAPSFQKSFAAERTANPASGSVGSAPAAGNDDLAKAREILKLRPDMKQQVVNELLKKGVNPSGL